MALDLDSAFGYLNKSFSAERLSHAYLITGPSGSGKNDLALRLISLINKSSQEEFLANAISDNVRLVQPESKSRRIKVEQIRDLEEMFHQKANKGSYKIGIIQDADRLGEQAENAFLKTLEEPPLNCLVLLITAFPEQLLDTILSRCIEVPLMSSESNIAANEYGDRLRDLLKSVRLDVGVSEALKIARSFSDILKDAKEQSEKVEDKERKLESQSFAKTTDGRWLKDREDYHKAIAQSRYLGIRSDLIEVLISWFGDALRHKKGYTRLDFSQHSEFTSSLSSGFSVDELMERMGSIEKLRDDLGTNVQESLAIEVSFLRAFANNQTV
ncbi:MAG: hypothetical protein VYB73_07190 [Verrucomicrobiota bacterium]|nr:hypothetical protein [Verrucomicrobiota bacterium]